MKFFKSSRKKIKFVWIENLKFNFIVMDTELKMENLSSRRYEVNSFHFWNRLSAFEQVLHD